MPPHNPTCLASWFPQWPQFSVHQQCCQHCSCSTLDMARVQHLSLLLYFLCFIFMWIEEIRIWYLWNVQSDARSCCSLIAEATALAFNYLVQSFDNLVFLLISCSLFHTNAADLKKMSSKSYFPAIPFGISYTKYWGNPLKQSCRASIFWFWFKLRIMVYTSLLDLACIIQIGPRVGKSNIFFNCIHFDECWH